MEYLEPATQHWIEGLLDMGDFKIESAPTHKMTAAAVQYMFAYYQALWKHSNDPQHPHVVLTSGKHSNSYLDSQLVLQHPVLCKVLAKTLADKIVAYYNRNALDLPEFYVIGSDHTAAIFSYQVAVYLRAQHGFTRKKRSFQCGYDMHTLITETQEWTDVPIDPTVEVLQIEDLITTRKTLRAVREGVTQGNRKMVGGKYEVSFAPIIGTIALRSTKCNSEYGETIFLSMFHGDTWQPQDCPLCTKGSVAIENPKAHWNQLISA